MRQLCIKAAIDNYRRQRGMHKIYMRYLRRTIHHTSTYVLSQIERPNYGRTVQREYNNNQLFGVFFQAKSG